MGNPNALSTSGGVTRRRVFGISTNHGDPSASERDTPADDLTNHPERRRVRFCARVKARFSSTGIRFKKVISDMVSGIV